jgi:hypothetical protein
MKLIEKVKEFLEKREINKLEKERELKLRKKILHEKNLLSEWDVRYTLEDNNFPYCIYHNNSQYYYKETYIHESKTVRNFYKSYKTKQEAWNDIYKMLNLEHLVKE